MANTPVCSRRMAELSTISRALARFVEGYSQAMYRGRRYGVRKRTFNAGCGVKLVAEALDGTDYISLNHYALRSGRSCLKPCEMAEAKVSAFLHGAAPLSEPRQNRGRVFDGVRTQAR